MKKYIYISIYKKKNNRGKSHLRIKKFIYTLFYLYNQLKFLTPDVMYIQINVYKTLV